jgi:uncharacterized membrane protein
MTGLDTATVRRAAPEVDARAYRLSDIDMLRGLVIAIMAIDHTRDFVLAGTVQDPTTNPDISAAIFFTRWVTHFCAPVFVFLAGTSAGLMAARRSSSWLAGFLLKRGVWLIVVEFFVISTGWSFSPLGLEQLDGLIPVAMQVIWAIGASMVVLAVAQFLGVRTCLFIGVAIIFGHNLLDPFWPHPGAPPDAVTSTGPLWAALHSQVIEVLGPFRFRFQYPLLPWIGVMLFGFGASQLFLLPPERRRRLLLAGGLAGTVGFVLLRASGVYGDPDPWQAGGSALRTTIDFLNTSKYPPSLLYLLMTLGPAAILCALADRVPEMIRRPLITFGRVPFAFYVVHIYLIHTIAIAIGVAQGFQPRQMAVNGAFLPAGYGLPLPLVYVVWALILVTLYPLCRWVAGIKARRRDWWLSYV